MNNFIYIAAAGSGKTTFIVEQAKSLREKILHGGRKILIVTYTVNNQNNIREKIIRCYGCIPAEIEIIGWYGFLLNYWIRPFKGTVFCSLYDHHVGLKYVSGVSGKTKLGNGRTITTYHSDNEKFLDKEYNIYSDKVAEFAYKCWEKNKDALISRMSNIVDTIYVDEAQDLAAWDFELIRVLCTTENVNCILCADPRQHTFSTTPSQKNKKYTGKIDEYIRRKINNRKHSYITIDEEKLSYSHRCGSEICKFASNLTKNNPATLMCDCPVCNERRSKYNLTKGVFVVREKDVKEYVSVYDPMTLVWDKNTKILVETKTVLNWGESKGLEADATLIYMTKALLKFYNSRKRRTKEISPQTLCKFYVAVTRAKYTVGLVVPDDFDNSKIGVPFWRERVSNKDLPLIF